MEAKKIGSHNSMTFLPVKQWYFKPLFWTARCQNVPINEQFWKYGVRLFDLRVRFNKNGDVVFAHGPIKFECDIHSILFALDIYSQSVTDKVYVRVILESNSPMKNQKEQEERFIHLCEDIQKTYTHLIFFGGNRKYDWEVIYNFGTEEPSLDDKYSSTTGTKLDDLWPWLYAKTHNKKNIQKGTDKDYLFIDFVDMR